MSNLVQFLGSAKLDGPLQRAMKELMTRAIRQSQKSREQIAEEMAALVETDVTVHMLNSYTANSKQAVRFPAAFVPAFCCVTGDDRLQRMLLSPYLRSVLQLGEHELAIRRDVDHLRGLECLQEIQQ